MIKSNKFLITAEEYSDSSWNAANLTSEDCTILISYSSCICRYERIVIYLRHVEAPTLLVTGNQHLEVTKQANMCPVISQEEYDSAKVTTFPSQIVFDYVLNMLFSVIYPQNLGENTRNLENKQRLMQGGLLKEYRKT